MFLSLTTHSRREAFRQHPYPSQATTDRLYPELAWGTAHPNKRWQARAPKVRSILRAHHGCKATTGGRPGSQVHALWNMRCAWRRASSRLRPHPESVAKVRFGSSTLPRLLRFGRSHLEPRNPTVSSNDLRRTRCDSRRSIVLFPFFSLSR